MEQTISHTNATSNVYMTRYETIETHGGTHVEGTHGSMELEI